MVESLSRILEKFSTILIIFFSYNVASSLRAFSALEKDCVVGKKSIRGGALFGLSLYEKRKIR